MRKIFVGKGEKKVYLLANKANQHGLIAGATGTGKTVTLKILAEQFSAMGVPCILSDVKGDLTNLSLAGEMNEKISQRLEEIGKKEFSFTSFPVNIWDVYGEDGIPLRVTISEMGPVFLGTILDLNETQLAVLNIAFHVADKKGLLLIDIKDLRSLLNEVLEGREEYSKLYGAVSPQSVHAILRKLLFIEDLGGNIFFGERSIEISDMLTKDIEGRGTLNIISAFKLVQNPTIYSIFLLYLLNELFELLPEVGNPEIPKLVFFFDEAHLLFESCPKHLQEKIEQLVRLIRSKGVGVYFVTQDPLDIPSDIAGQLGNRVIHGLRAFSPKDKKSIKGIVETFRENPDLNAYEAISNLRTGEALLSFLEESGNPSMVEKALILPPQSSFRPLTSAERETEIKRSPLYSPYKEYIDRESAYEILQKDIEMRQKEEALEEREKQAEKKTKTRSKSKQNNDLVGKSIHSFLGTITRALGREVARNLLGGLKRR